MIETMQHYSGQIAGQVGSYGRLIAESVALIAVGGLLVYLLSRLVRRLLGSYLQDHRLPRVTFGTLYVLVLLLTAAVVLKQAGFDVSRIAPIAIICLFFLAVVVYFLIPYLPRLPFLPGHTIETGGVMGCVESVSPFNTAIRKSDGTMVYIPNAKILASQISNYSHASNRRIELTISVAPDSDMPAVRDRLLARMVQDPRVMTDPGPRVQVTGGDALGVQLSLQCWVRNADFGGTRSDLWFELVRQINANADLSLSVERHEVFIREPR